MSCLETVGLVDHYSPIEKILDHVNIQVQEESIYGFLGLSTCVTVCYILEILLKDKVSDDIHPWLIQELILVICNSSAKVQTRQEHPGTR